VEKWSLRKIARHMRIGRRTIAKYLEAPAAKAWWLARSVAEEARDTWQYNAAGSAVYGI
jgi:hypothetical protein